MLLAVSVALAGCVTQQPSHKDVERLLAHPEAKAAFKAAPNFTEEALNTIARLDYELNSRTP